MSDTEKKDTEKKDTEKKQKKEEDDKSTAKEDKGESKIEARKHKNQDKDTKQETTKDKVDDKNQKTKQNDPDQLPKLVNVEEEVVKTFILDRACFFEAKKEINRSCFKDSRIAYELFTIIATDTTISIAAIKDTLVNSISYGDDLREKMLSFVDKLYYIDDHDALIQNLEFNIELLKKRRYVENLINVFTKNLKNIKDGLANFTSLSYASLKQGLLKSFIAMTVSSGVDTIRAIDLRGSVLDELEEISNRKILDIVKSHSRLLNRYYPEFRKGHFVIIAARPSVGKTTFSLNLVYENSIKRKLKCLFISLEMGNIEIIQKLAKIYCYYRFSEENTATLIDSIEAVTNDRIYLSKENITTPDDIRSVALKIIGTSGLDYIIIDYLQLMKSSAFKYRKSYSKHEEVSDISRGLKLLSQELEVPIITLCQLNRDVEKRRDKNSRPFLWDLRDSGSIEQDADAVFLLHRVQEEEESIDSIDPPSADEGGDRYYQNEKRSIKFFIEKNRHGATGDVDFVFHSREGVFKEQSNSIFDGDFPA